METSSYKKQNSKSKQADTEKKKDNRSQPTYEKNGELAIAYNIAYNRVSLFLDNLSATKSELRSRFQDHNKKVELADKIDRMQKCSLFSNDACVDEKSYSIYVELMHLMFNQKAKTTNTKIIDGYIPIINLFLLKLWRLRDYHSHYHHSDFGLYFNEDQQKVFYDPRTGHNDDKVYNHTTRRKDNYKEGIFNTATNQTKANYSKETFRLYDDLFDTFKFFDKKGNQYKINGEGINIFLSLFLTKREMHRFLSDREFCSRTSPLEYKVKREVYTYYCHRDSANILRKALKKGEGFDESELIQAKAATLENYKNAMPFFMYDQLSEEEKEKHFRRKNRFIELAVDYFTEVVKLEGVEWRTNDYTERLHKKDSTNRHFKPIVKKTYLFKAKGDLNRGDKWKIKEDEIELQLQLLNKVKAQLRIGKHLLTHWLALSFYKYKNQEDIINHLKTYCTAYYKAVKAIQKNKELNAADVEVLEKMHGVNFSGNRKLQKLFKKSKQTNVEYKAEVKQKIIGRIDFFETMKAEYSKENTLLHSLQQVKSDEQDEEKLKQFKDAKRTRYTKNDLIKKAIKHLGRANLEREMVQQLDKYHYLFDVKPLHHDKLISQFVEKLPDEVQEIYRQAVSFDDLFLKVMDLVILELNKPIKRWERIEEKGINYWASKLKVKWYDEKRNRFDRVNKSRTNILLENHLTETDSNGVKNEIILLSLPKDFLEKFGAYEPLHKVLTYENVEKEIKSNTAYNSSYFCKDDNLYKAFKDLRDSKSENANKEKLRLLHKIRIWKREDAIIKRVIKAYEEKMQVSSSGKYRIINEKPYNLQMAIKGVYVKLKRNDLFSTRFFIAHKKFEKLVAYQLHHQIWKKGETKTIEELFTALHQIYIEARGYISALLNKEQKVAYTLPQESTKKEIFQDLDYLKFQKVIERLNLDINTKTIRNNAFHADFSGPKLDYKTFNELKNLL